MDSAMLFSKNNASPARRMPFRSLAVLGLALLLGAGFFVHQNAKEEERRMLAEMKAQADVLIWAFEGGARSVAPGPSYRQRLIEEIARQPHILYLAVTDAQGRVVAHSEPERVGSLLRRNLQLPALETSPQSAGHIVRDQNETVFEVTKPFTPAIRHGHGRHGMHRRSPPPEYRTPDDSMPVQGERQAPPQQTPERGMPPLPSEPGGLYIFVGMDMEPFTERLQSHILYTALVAFSLALAALASLALLSFRQNYLASHRLLRDARSLTLQLFENLPIGLVITDDKGAIQLCNRHSMEMLGLSDGPEPRAATFIQDYPPREWQPLLEELEHGGPVLERETTLTRPGKKTLPVSISASAVNKGDGSRSGYLFILRDLGEVKKLQQQLRLNERLTALGNMAAGVAHEVRNPLSTIKGYATYLAGKFSANDPAGETARMMIEEVERLNRVVSDLLNVARAGRLSIAPTPLAPAIEKALRLAKAEAESKGVSLEKDLSGLGAPDLSLPLDADKFVQALLNLVINGIQATDNGGHVRIKAEYAPDNASGQVLVRIIDSGKGMDRETRERIFTPYFTTKASGTGLGLTISHQIIEQHGGRILVSSKPGEGAVFTLLLPAGAEDAENEAEETKKGAPAPGHAPDKGQPA